MLLALDTSSPRVTVAITDGDMVLAERVSDQTMKHGELLAPLIAETVAEAGLIMPDVTAIAVGVGPGPFTGLRVGLVTARTLAHVLEVPVYGVCSLDVLAAEAMAEGAVGGDFLVATDARRKEVYWASYVEGRRVEGPEVERPADLADRLTPGTPVVGEGAALYPDLLGDPVGPIRASAGWLGRIVAEEAAELLDPEPLYLRRPDAVAAHAPKKVS
ncbi:tRNA (adenosine(37)-N6)-threonylcarbamoyltransferase complex dimerization subunit type 1 TsaB [Nocardioides alcanivorans]|uniref:tRNA (adenosine(37)-N6)-threonylcarbamoyltransferase complex dimerization subunit type 1 TsaB n=1 Tax=Nocardioides alcanivorans TaxID=2897352 RepID=UPI001F478DC2|nr:tRNA (adenosine(37)-N6)-threonylcarbamoyltransferase complex dimerization subunit type 1 TsaB [Nocardioides alcanivorans]